MPIKSILLYLKAKTENHLINECRTNYANDILYLMLERINAFICKEKMQLKAWSLIYNEIKNISVIEDNRTTKEIEEDVLELFRNLNREQEK